MGQYDKEYKYTMEIHFEADDDEGAEEYLRDFFYYMRNSSGHDVVEYGKLEEGSN